MISEAIGESNIEDNYANFLVSDLSPVEKRLLDKFISGESLDLRERDPATDNPLNGDDWESDRQIRGEVIAALLLGAIEPSPARVSRIQLAGANISGALNVREGENCCSAEFLECRFDIPPVFDKATTKTIAFVNSILPGFKASSVIIHGDLGFQNCIIDHEIDLLGAHIDGQLNLGGAQIYLKKKPLFSPDGYALIAQRITVGQGIFCEKMYAAKGEIQLLGAQISGQAKFSGAHLNNSHGKALHAEQATISGHCFFNQAFIAEGEVFLQGAQIGGQLSLSGAKLSNPGGDALIADNASISLGMFCREKFSAEGEVSLRGTHVTGELNLNGACLSNAHGKALTADQAKVDGYFFCSKGFKASGEIWLLNAQISGDIDLSGAQLSNKNGTALTAQKVRSESLYLNNGFYADGCVDLYRAQIKTLHDEPGQWPDSLQLNGFVYEELQPYRDALKGVDRWTWPWIKNNSRFTLLEKNQGRLAWLARGKSEYYPQPYEQLAKYYRGLGHDQQARIVLLMKQRHHRQTQGLGGRVLGQMFDWLVGYGYFPGRAFLWMLICWVVGSIYFSYYPAEATYPDRTVIFHPTLYILDLMLPVISLGQRNVWWLAGGGQWLAATILILIGWVLSIALLAGITRVLTRY